MTRKDYWYAAGLSIFSFVLCGIRYWYPPEKYFDEVYYPRSAAEYLLGQPQYEWTHPPLAKLLIALSMLLFGGAHSPLGDSSYGWRFLNVVVGAATVFLLYVFAKRLTRSTVFSVIATGLLVLDGFHFAQSRISTPEITVAFFSLLILYAFTRYMDALQERPAESAPPLSKIGVFASYAIAGGFAVGILLIGRLAGQSGAAVWLMSVFLTLAFYTVLRFRLAPPGGPRLWLWMTGLACGLGAASKWNDLFDLIVICGFACGIVLFPRLKWRLPLDAFLAAVLSVTIAVYLTSYIPFFLTPQPASYETRNDLTGLMDLQYQMYYYHDVTVTHNTPHPYSSKWWEWPLLYQPIAYWYKDYRSSTSGYVTGSCCVAEIMALPNPVSWWFGLLSIPFLGYLAWVKRNRAYLLLFVAYFAQWLPWMASPRMLFEYHFFPNDAIILLADTIALQWIYDRAKASGFQQELLARWSIGVFLAGCLIMFVYFYPILAGDHINYAQWQSRMWFRHWIIGPG